MPKKVMVIDDEADIQLYLMAALEDEDYVTCSLQPGQDVEAAVQAERPDLIILDIMMPRRSGISIYRRLRDHDAFARIPIMLVSGMSTAKDFMPGGFRDLVQDETVPLPNDFLEKPVKIPSLIEKVAALVGDAKA